MGEKEIEMSGPHDRMTPEMRNHVQSGGLDIRKIGL